MHSQPPPTPTSVTAPTPNPPPPWPVRLIRRLPIVGYLLRCLDEERHKELAGLTANFVMFAVLMVILFGLPAFVTIVYGMVVVVGIAILASTRG
jgi:hypothetical protein